MNASLNGKASGKASILAIGTELTTGQIINGNAAALAQKLVPLGIEVVLHEAVADDRATIRRALDRCWEVSRILIICGGLGPTTDDFTREVVADWLGQSLEFYEPSWKKIEERLSRAGIPIAASNRQQAFYPKGADVLKNAQGTADGFSCSINRGGETGRVWVLPGPPREIEAIWKDCDLSSAIARDLPQGIEPLQLLTWDCLGKSEAELGEITERALEGSGLQTGYRYHRPYIEVKVWIPRSRVTSSAGWISKLETAIAPWVVARNGDDLARQLVQKLARADEIDIIDSCSMGLLTERLAPQLRSSSGREVAERVAIATEFTAPSSPEEWITQSLASADDQALTLAIAGFAPSGEWAVGFSENGRSRHEVLQSPWRGSQEMIERSRAYAVEVALKKWCDWLNQSVS